MNGDQPLRRVGCMQEADQLLPHAEQVKVTYLLKKTASIKETFKNERKVQTHVRSGPP